MIAGVKLSRITPLAFSWVSKGFICNRPALIIITFLARMNGFSYHFGWPMTLTTA
jgi:hypothetical protein